MKANILPDSWHLCAYLSQWQGTPAASSPSRTAHLRWAQRHLLRIECPKRELKVSLAPKQSLWGVTDHPQCHLTPVAFLALSLDLTDLAFVTWF